MIFSVACQSKEYLPQPLVFGSKEDKGGFGAGNQVSLSWHQTQLCCSDPAVLVLSEMPLEPGILGLHQNLPGCELKRLPLIRAD